MSLRCFISFYNIMVYLFTSMLPGCQHLYQLCIKKEWFWKVALIIYTFFLQGTVVNPAKRQSREVICWFSAWLTLVAWLSVILYSHPVFLKRDFTTTHCILPHNDVCDHIIFPRNSTPRKSPYILTSACHSKANQVHKNHHKCAILEFFLHYLDKTPFYVWQS